MQIFGRNVDSEFKVKGPSIKKVDKEERAEERKDRCPDGLGTVMFPEDSYDDFKGLNLGIVKIGRHVNTKTDYEETERYENSNEMKSVAEQKSLETEYAKEFSPFGFSSARDGMGKMMSNFYSRMGSEAPFKAEASDSGETKQTGAFKETFTGISFNDNYKIGTFKSEGNVYNSIVPDKVTVEKKEDGSKTEYENRPLPLNNYQLNNKGFMASSDKREKGGIGYNQTSKIETVEGW
jgi:hypothetical protein